MPQVLVIGLDDEFCLNVERIFNSSGAQNSGLRFKSTTALHIAENWLAMGGFCGVVFDPRLDFEQQNILAPLLWNKDMLAPFILYEPENSGARDTEARLMGAQPFSGKGAEGRLSETFRVLADTTPKPGTSELLTVAVVEDLDSPRDIICTYLEGIDNLKTIGFAGVDQVLSALNEDPARYNLVITDIRMPKKSGVELIEAMRSNSLLMKIPIIVLTAYGTADILMECLKAGATGFMVKPPKKKDLKQEIARVRRILRFKLDPRLVFPNEIEKMREILASKGFF